MAFAALCGHTWLIPSLTTTTTPAASADTTLFHYIACGGSLSFAAACLDLGFPANRQGREGMTPLHVACANRNPEMAEFLLDRCTDAPGDLLLTDESGWNAAHHAAAANLGGVLARVLELTGGKAASAADTKGRTPFHVAAMRDSVECVKILLNPKKKDEEKEIINVVNNNTVRKLVSAQDASGLSSLHLACRGGAAGSAAYLLELGADIEARGRRNDFTPLHVAAAAGKAECCLLLLTQGAAVDAAAVNGATALHLAAKNGDVRTLAVILENGCAVDSRDGAGMTPLHVAAFYNHPGAIQILVQNKADVNAKDKCGNAPLALAVSKGSISAVKELLKCADIDLELQNNNGESPLHIAGRAGASHAVNIIMNHAWKEYTHSLLVK